MNKILIICSHPDDEILGSGGTVARLIKEGSKGYTFIIGGGREGMEIQNYETSKKANEIICCDLIDPMIPNPPDNQFDSIPMIRFVECIERLLDILKPSIIFTHFRNDLNIDHRITYRAVITATRPMRDCPVREIYSFEIPSSTEWNFPLSFSPNVFFDITKTIDQKIKALECYETEMRPNPHPRSFGGIQYLAGYRGYQCGVECAEAFEAVRILR